MTSPKKIGFLSFGAWHPGGGLTHTAADAHRQTLELAVAAEEIGIDAAFVRVHRFSRQLASPFPLLAAIGVRTTRIEIGTGVIDMRYENPLYMAETAAAADLLAGGRLQLRHQPRLARAGLARRRRSATRSMPTRRGRRQHSFERRSPASASSGPTSAAAQATRCSRSSLSRPVSASGSGGARAHARPPCGRARRA